MVIAEDIDFYTNLNAWRICPMLLLTIVVITILLIISYVLFDKDIMAPPTAVALVMLFGALCCFYNEKRWGLEFSVYSLNLIAAGIIATMIGGLIGVWLSNFPKVSSYSFSHELTEPEEINVQPLKTYFCIAVQLVAFYLVAAHIRKLTGISSIVDAVGVYRELTTRLADANDPSLRMPTLTKNLAQFSGMIGIVYSYIVGNNLVASKRKKISINWLPLIIYSLTTFIQGDRSNMIREWVVVLVVAYTIQKRSVGWKNTRETRRVIRVIALSVVVMGALFAGIRELVGRTTDMDPLYYVTFYAGTPTAVLNQVWENPITKPTIFGQRMLYYFNQSTTALFGKPGRYNFYYDFLLSPNNSPIGNAPTAFRPAYVEFGPVGFFVFFLLAGVLFTCLYCKCRNKKGKNPIDFRLLTYAYIAYVFLMYFYSTFFDFISHVMIKYMVEWLVLRWFLVGWQFKSIVKFKSGIRFRLRPGTK